MVSHISAAEAAQSFPEMLERVHQHGAVYVVEQAGEPICRIAPVMPAHRTVRELIGCLQEIPRPDEDYLDTVEQIAQNQPVWHGTPWES